MRAHTESNPNKPVPTKDDEYKKPSGEKYNAQLPTVSVFVRSHSKWATDV